MYLYVFILLSLIIYLNIYADCNSCSANCKYFWHKNTSPCLKAEHLLISGFQNFKPFDLNLSCKGNTKIMTFFLKGKQLSVQIDTTQLQVQTMNVFACFIRKQITQYLHLMLSQYFRAFTWCQPCCSAVYPPWSLSYSIQEQLPTKSTKKRTKLVFAHVPITNQRLSKTLFFIPCFRTKRVCGNQKYNKKSIFMKCNANKKFYLRNEI